MTGPILKVDAAALQRAGAAFDQAGGRLSAIRPERPLADAATSVAQLETAAACQAAAAAINAEMSAHADGARTYASNLAEAAGRYETTGQVAASALDSVHFPN